MKKITFIIALISLLISCKDKKVSLLPNVSGAAGEVVVVLNANLHQTPIQDSITKVLTEEYPMLPQQEPWFKPLIISEKAFTSVLQRHRNLIFVKLGPAYPQPKLNLKTDTWAKTQCILTASGPNMQVLGAYITAHADRIREVIEQAEIKRNIAYYNKYEAEELKLKIQKTFKCTMHFPDGYVLRKSGDHFMWISLETPATSQGIFMYSYPYNNQKPDAKSILKKRNEVLKLNVPGSLPNTYMTTSPVVLPEVQLIKQKQSSALNFIQIRGLWEVQNDYMGGPFVSETLVDTSNNRVITLESYVYAPKADKRNLLRKTYSVLRTFELNKPK